MDQHTATEEAYKNGYEKGVREAVEEFGRRVREILWEPRLPSIAEINGIAEETVSKLKKR